MILIDTNVFVDHLRNYAPAVSFFESIGGKDVIFSAITETELLIGNANNDNEKKEKLLHFLHQWDKMAVNNHIAVLAGDIGRNHNLAVPDSIIAATAILNNAELITKNAKDFKKVTGLKLSIPY